MKRSAPMLALLVAFTTLSQAQSVAVSGLWFDPSLDGEGYNVVVSPTGTVIFFYGYSQAGERLWLVSETLPEPLSFGTPVELTMFQGQGGTFQAPAGAPDGLSDWGTLMVDFESCTVATFILEGQDGSKTSMAHLLAGISGADCSNTTSQCDVSGNSQPDCLPGFKSLDLYSAESIWNKPIPPSAQLDPDNAMLSMSLVNSAEMVIQVRQYSAPVYFVNASTPRYDLEIACGQDFDLGVSRLLDVPIPDFAQPSNDVDGAENPVPPMDCGVDSDQDNHMVLLDLDRRCEYGLWQARKIDETWYASVANNLSIDGDGVYPGGVASKGSGFPFLAGVIWPDELAAGSIDHALVFSYPFTSTGGPVSPATFSDGITTSANALPMGALVRLDPLLNLDSLGLNSHEMTIAQALQTYGMYLGDTGSDSGGIGLYAIDPASVVGNPYQGLLPDEDFVLLDNIPLDRLQVLALGEQVANFTEIASVDDGPCSAFERITKRNPGR